jgi:hypothetical protein
MTAAAGEVENLRAKILELDHKKLVSKHLKGIDEFNKIKMAAKKRKMTTWAHLLWEKVSSML